MSFCVESLGSMPHFPRKVPVVRTDSNFRAGEEGLRGVERAFVGGQGWWMEWEIA